MAELTYTQSAKFSGISRATLYRHIKEGKVSTKRNRRGQNVIDTAELIRVYGEPESHDTSHKTSQQDIMEHRKNDELVSVLKERIASLEVQLEQSQQREERLLKMLETEQEKTKVFMLEDSRRRKGFWSRLFGMSTESQISPSRAK